MSSSLSDIEQQQKENSTNNANSSTTNNDSTTNNKGIAGRINYGQWDRVASDLISETEEQEEKEKELSSKALGLDGKYARSEAEAAEREKAKQVKQVKKTLEKYKKRENAVLQQMTNVFSSSDDKQVIRITRDTMEAGTRVLSLEQSTGISSNAKDSTIIVTQDLSHLECSMPANSIQQPKSYDGDVDNGQPETKPGEMRKVFGLIKLFVAHMKNCTIILRSKVISGTLEMSHCENVVVKIEKEATVATLQLDLCQNCHIQFCDAPSSQNNPYGAMKTIYWGEDANDRIYHAGVSNTQISLVRDGFVEEEITIDYKEDGASAVGNATLEEYQFVTSVVNTELKTEKVVRSGGTTGKTQRPMTERELEDERVMRDKAVDMAMEKAIRFVDKGEGKMVEPQEEDQKDGDDDEVEEIYTNQAEIDDIVADCELHKARGNEAFGTGEYAQAVLLYTLALDKADELPTSTGAGKKQLFACHIVLSNRSASFLKLGEHEKALADATRAVKLEPNYVKASFRKGLALHAMGRYAEALPVLSQAQKLEPKNKQIKQALQFAEVRMNQEMRKRME